MLKVSRVRSVATVRVDKSSSLKGAACDLVVWRIDVSRASHASRISPALAFIGAHLSPLAA